MITEDVATNAAKAASASAERQQEGFRSVEDVGRRRLRATGMIAHVVLIGVVTSRNERTDHAGNRRSATNHNHTHTGEFVYVDIFRFYARKILVSTKSDCNLIVKKRSPPYGR